MGWYPQRNMLATNEMGNVTNVVGQTGRATNQARLPTDLMIRGISRGTNNRKGSNGAGRGPHLDDVWRRRWSAKCLNQMHERSLWEDATTESDISYEKLEGNDVIQEED
ncbi:hypothetical protein Syun_030078 [Stephania yunnanensis]|uniref:Uncharacterized protein n=1 Tax=Stephania yunnanensis TaxID=152371 RepID=A0AAP0EF44_9MAGN